MATVLLVWERPTRDQGLTTCFERIASCSVVMIS